MCFKFCFKLGKNFTETFLQKVFGDESMSRTSTYEWYRRFKDVRTSTEDDPHLGRPSASTDDVSIAQVQVVIHSN